MQFHFNNKINYFLFQIKMYTFNLRRAHVYDSQSPIPKLPIEQFNRSIDRSFDRIANACNRHENILRLITGTFCIASGHVSKQIRYVNFQTNRNQSKLSHAMLHCFSSPLFYFSFISFHFTLLRCDAMRHDWK